MLEIKNVTKIYKTKGGVDTVALDNVSISFRETGLVFLLGKSGSGKSTLLNVCGGLDDPTSGEVIVKGRSSKDFSGSDFDSYRNTFVGFIFQEYNILDEFNVEDNIALALELQGKPKDKVKINSLLKEVELDSYAKRRPNTLSGGQKQRIAIARALVKDPQIIMADEPTGALDSATGKQVLETLKKLSQTRLVIVVSHDREFAEIYGDRIVELKDGKIISDVSKVHVSPVNVDENVSIISGNTLSIKRGSVLSDKNIRDICDFISSADGDVVVTKGESEIASFRKANRITEEGLRERFDATPDQQLKKYDGSEAKFIRSRLPAGKAVKIGASGLKLKPIRLFFTILLSFIAFVMFGLFSTLMLYNDTNVAAKSFAQSDYDYLNLSKNYQVTRTWPYDDSKYVYSNIAAFTDEEVEMFAEITGVDVFGYRSLGASVVNIAETSKSEDYVYEEYNYYKRTINRAAYIPEGNSERNLITGAYPENDDEICISSYLLDAFKHYGIDRLRLDGQGEFNVTEKAVAVNSAEDIIGEYIKLSVNGVSYYFKVTGVFNSGNIPYKYEALKNSIYDYDLSTAFNNYLNENLHGVAFFTRSFIDTLAVSGDKSDAVQYFDYCSNTIKGAYEVYKFDEYNYNVINKGQSSVYLDNTVAAYGENSLPAYFFEEGKTDLENDEMLIPFSYVLYFDMLYGYFINSYYEIVRSENPDYSPEMIMAEVSELYSQLNYEVNVYVDGRVYEDGGYIYLSSEELLEIRQSILDKILKIGVIEITLNIDGEESAFKIAGFYDEAVELSDSRYTVTGTYYSQEFYNTNFVFYEDIYNFTDTTKYVPEENAVFNGLYLSYDGSESFVKKLLSNTGSLNENEVFYLLSDSLYSSVLAVNETAAILSKVFLIIGLIFAVFSALLLFNFISMSIASKRKEIGILRAVGARGIDVFKIFFAEAGIIIAICTVLSIIGTIVVCAVLNNIIMTQLGLGVTLFVFGILSALIMIAIALAVALIATFLPVFFASRKKPVDAIRSL